LAEDRDSYLGGPDAAAILGLDLYKTPLDIIIAKRGLAPKRPPSWPMRCGLALERLMLEDYADRHGVVVLHQPGFRRHPKYAWAGSHIDGDVPSVPRILECKTTDNDIGYGVEGTDQVRPGVLIQVCWYLAIWDRPECDVPVLVRNRELKEYRVRRDLDLERIVFATCGEFWERYIEGDEEYHLDGSEAALRYLQARYPLAGEDFMEGPEEDAAALALRQARQDLIAAEAVVREAEVRVQSLIGDACGLKGEWGKITWRNERGRTNYAAICKDPRVAPVASPLLEEHRTPGGRVLRVPRDWTKETDGE